MEQETLDTPVEVSNDLALDITDFGIETEVSTTQETEEATPKATTEEGVKEIDYSTFLNELSGKIKFNHEPVTINSVDEIITNFQKGLNYDKVQEQLNELSSSEEMTYLKTKAEENGLTTKEFIKLVKEQEEKQREKVYEERYNELVENGVSEDIVKDMITKLKKTDELERKINQMELKEKQTKAEQEKTAKHEEFVKRFPNVDLANLPKEVVIADDKISAYLQWQNVELMKQLEIAKQNEKATKQNPVKETGEHGGVVTEQEDDFLKGLFGKK